jgi:hypothetical protein
MVRLTPPFPVRGVGGERSGSASPLPLRGLFRAGLRPGLFLGRSASLLPGLEPDSGGRIWLRGAVEGAVIEELPYGTAVTVGP